jgi:hypothetical protein
VLAELRGSQGAGMAGVQCVRQKAGGDEVQERKGQTCAMTGILAFALWALAVLTQFGAQRGALITA